MFQTPSESGLSIILDTGDPSLSGLYCMRDADWENVRMLLLLFGAMLGSWLGVFLGSSSIYGVNQVSMRSTLYGTTICDLSCTRYFQFGVIVPYLMNGTVESSSSNTTLNWGETLPVSGFITRDDDQE